MLKGYEGVDWKRLKGYQVPEDDKKTESWIYQHGWRLWHPESDRYLWLCRTCHLQKRKLKGTFREPIYKADKASSGANTHMADYHNMKDNQQIKRPKRKGTMDDHVVTNGHNRESERDNEAAVSFNQDEFKAKLYDWIISDNITFNQLESEKLRALLEYLNPRCKGHVPSHQTASRTIASIYSKVLGSVTEALHSAITRISISFDLWTSKNKLALLGLCAHFINNAEQISDYLASSTTSKGQAQRL